MEFKYIDVHCHPNLEELKKEQEAVIARMREEGVLGIVVGVNLGSSREAVRLSQEHAHLFACVGLHPNYTQKENLDISKFSELLREEKVVGVGECGIDYYRLQPTVDSGQQKQKQWEVFKQHVELAIEHDKPLMIHCRPSKGSTHSNSSGQVDAYEEVADYLESRMLDVRHPTLRGNMHFFVGNLEVAKRFWALGFTTSFTGVLTFTHDYDEVVRQAPLEMILTETDAPFAAPAPYRGGINYPTYVPLVARAIAANRGEPEECVREAVFRNAKRVFGL